MVKHLSFSLVVAALLAAGFVASPALALTVPEVYIVDTIINETGPFQAGQEITGTFTVQNFGKDLVPSLPTSIDLMTGYDSEGFPQELVDSYPLDPIRVEPGETTRVLFRVKLPAAFSGEAGLYANIEIIPGANRSGTPTPPFEISGGVARAEILTYGIELNNGLKVPPNSGPSIYKPGKGAATSSASEATLIVNLDADSVVGVYPSVTIYEERSGVGADIAWEGKGDEVSITPNSTTTVSFPLPNLGYDDKVYAGEVRFLDNQGVDRSGVLYFRYISRSGEAMGRVATFSFSGATPDTKEVEVLAEVVGAPIDFTILDKSPEPVSGTLVFEALSNKDRVISSASTTVSLRASAVEAKVKLAIPSGQQYLGYRLSLIADSGQKLDIEEGTLFGESTDSPITNPIIVLIGVVFGGILLAALVLWFVIKRGSSRAGVPTAAAFAIVFAIALVAAPTAEALTCDDDSPSVWFNAPAPGQVFQCGVRIPVSISGIYDACSNSGSNETMWAVFQNQIFGKTATAWDNSAVSGEHERNGLSASMTLDGPPRDGTYYIDAYMQNASGCWTKLAHARQSFQVVGCDVCTNINGDQSVVPSGMVSDNAGVCSCTAGGVYNTARGICERPGGGSLVDCPAGYKWCNGACVPNSTDCTAPATCPLPDTGDVYCVELFTKGGVRTSQLANLSLVDLEKAFGFGVREAYYAQIKSAAASQPTYPIFGVVGRGSSIAVTTNQGSSGCGGVSCAYEVNGCISGTATSGVTTAECSAIGDIPGPSGVGPTANIDAMPPVVGKGGRCDVIWGSHEMSTCQVFGTGINVSTLAGSTSTPPLQNSASYVLTCVGQNGLTYKDVASCSVNPEVDEF